MVLRKNFLVFKLKQEVVNKIDFNESKEIISAKLLKALLSSSKNATLFLLFVNKITDYFVGWDGSDFINDELTIRCTVDFSLN